MALSGCDPGPEFAARRRLACFARKTLSGNSMGRQQPDEARLGDPGAVRWPSPERAPPKRCIFHSGRGSQYCSRDCQTILREHAFPASVGGKGNCYDNAAVLRRKKQPTGLFRDVPHLLQDQQGRVDLAQVLGNPPPSRNRHLPIHQPPLYPTPSAFRTGRKRPLRLRKQVAKTNTRSGTKPRQDQCKGSCRTMAALDAALAFLAS